MTQEFMQAWHATNKMQQQLVWTRKISDSKQLTSEKINSSSYVGKEVLLNA